MTGLIGRRRRRPAAPPPTMTNDPFAELGLDPAADLTDDEVRVAWRRIAAATHPDRADGGDPGRFAAAAAAYTELRTRYGRGEARAALASVSERGWVREARAGGAAGPGRGGWLAGRSRYSRLAALAEVGTRVRSGRPARLVARVLGVAVIVVAAVLAAGPGPAAPALVTGAVTWLALSIRRDLGPPPGRRHSGH